jgi:hypothetical protein
VRLARARRNFPAPSLRPHLMAAVERPLKVRSVMSNGRRLHPRSIDGRIGLALAAPAAANPLDKGSVRVSDSRTVHHKANFANATALWPVSAVTMSQAVTRETDGLAATTKIATPAASTTDRPTFFGSIRNRDSASYGMP